MTDGYIKSQQSLLQLMTVFKVFKHEA